MKLYRHSGTQRGALTIAFAFVPIAALANGAMGLGLEMFDFGYWLAYVGVTIVFEAWFIGRWAGIPWGASLGISTLANAITGIGCTQLAAVGLHTTFVGSALNPNPFLNAIVLFTGYGIISSLIEFVVWSLFSKDRPFIFRSIVGHLIGIPISLAILLIPTHPYRGLELTTKYKRRFALDRWAERSLLARIQETERVPNFSSVEEAISAITLEDSVEDLWASAFLPSYTRFSTSEGKTKPFEWNRSLNGARIGGGDEKWIWLIRPPERAEYERWIEVDLSTGNVRGRTILPKD